LVGRSRREAEPSIKLRRARGSACAAAGELYRAGGIRETEESLGVASPDGVVSAIACRGAMRRTSRRLIATRIVDPKRAANRRLQ
jgi:hypothetical protein